MVTTEDGQDEDKQQGAVVQTVSDPGQSKGGVLEALGEPCEVQSYGRSDHLVRTAAVQRDNPFADTLHDRQLVSGPQWDF